MFLPGESHGQRSLLGYSLWGRKSRTRLSTKPPTPPPGWERQPAVTKLGMSLQGGAETAERGAFRERCRDSDGSSSSSSDGKKTPLLSSQEGGVPLQWQEGASSSDGCPLLCEVTGTASPSERWADGWRFEKSGGDRSLHREETLPASPTHL